MEFESAFNFNSIGDAASHHRNVIAISAKPSENLGGDVMDIDSNPGLPQIDVQNCFQDQSGDLQLSGLPGTVFSPGKDWDLDPLDQEAMDLAYQQTHAPGAVDPGFFDNYINNDVWEYHIDPQLSTVKNPVLPSPEDPSATLPQVVNDIDDHGFQTPCQASAVSTDAPRSPTRDLNIPEQQQSALNPSEQAPAKRRLKLVLTPKVCKDIYKLGCNEEFGGEKERGKHILEAHGVKAYKCPNTRCTYETARHDNVKTHRINNCKFEVVLKRLTRPRSSSTTKSFRPQRRNIKDLKSRRFAQQSQFIEVLPPPNTPAIAEDATRVALPPSRYALEIARLKDELETMTRKYELLTLNLHNLAQTTV
ncbi:uncharacterized protein DFL_009260 [Arthrobotrys flagrans]|uniref:Uncharacterized protein n=1 Tax=Arthrobotrys flagrans TaxID=97331 RepID=A0A436ZR71_ARTFL|nr:hypothetical protein DFL_009260 [Arthrobotrys flagrans]